MSDPASRTPKTTPNPFGSRPLPPSSNPAYTHPTMSPRKPPVTVSIGPLEAGTPPSAVKARPGQPYDESRLLSANEPIGSGANDIPIWPAASACAPTMRDPFPVTRCADMDRGSQALVDSLVRQIDAASGVNQANRPSASYPQGSAPVLPTMTKE